jgi:hypothetical protein
MTRAANNWILATLSFILQFIGSPAYSQETTCPGVVMTYIAENKAALDSLTSGARTEEVYIGFDLLFCREVIHKGRKHYLVGASVVSEKRFGLARIVLLSSEGREIFEAPDGEPWLKQSYNVDSDMDLVEATDALYVELSDSESVIALARAGRDETEIRVYSILPTEKHLMTDYGRQAFRRNNGRIDLGNPWSGRYHFVDVNGDGRKELLINRRVRFSKGKQHQSGAIEVSGYKYRNQKLIYAFEKGTLMPLEVTNKYKSNLRKLFLDAKSDVNTPTLDQPGGESGELPAEDIAEAIFPGQSLKEKRKYFNVQSPDMDNTEPYLPLQNVLQNAKE